MHVQQVGPVGRLVAGKAGHESERTPIEILTSWDSHPWPGRCAAPDARGQPGRCDPCYRFAHADSAESPRLVAPLRAVTTFAYPQTTRPPEPGGRFVCSP